MRRVLSSGLLLALVFASPRSAKCDVLYQTGFEPPVFTAGQPVDGQGGWVARFAPAAGVISTAHPASGQQALLINSSDILIDPTNPFGYLTGVYRPGLGSPGGLFDFRVTPHVFLQAQVRLDGTPTPPAIDGDLISANFNVYNRTDLLAEIYLSSDGHAWVDNANVGYALSAPINLGQYYTLGIDLNFNTFTATYLLNGSLLGSLPLPDSARTDPEFVFNAVMLAVPSPVNGFPNYDARNYTGTFDNILVTAIPAPEPSSLALLALGGVALAGWYRGKQRAQSRAGA